MKIIEAKAQNITEQIKYNSATGNNSSEKCSRELDEKFRFVFNSNPQVKKMFTNEIDRMLMELYRMVMKNWKFMISLNMVTGYIIRIGL